MSALPMRPRARCVGSAWPPSSSGHCSTTPGQIAEIPSLVYEESGEILGFLGSNVRRMRFDGRGIRMACSAHQLTHPRVRNKAIGSSPYATLSRGAPRSYDHRWRERDRSADVGGVGRANRTCQLSNLRSGFCGRSASRRIGCCRAEPALRPSGPIAPVVRLLDLAATRLIDPARANEAESEQLTPSALLDHLPDVAEGLRLVPEYDVDYLTWLFGELDRVGDERVFPDRVPRGPLLAELVTRDSQVIGWYVSHLKPGGLCRVLQVAAQPREAGAVLDRLVRRADELGAAGIYGRLEPRLVGPLSERRTLLRFSHGRLLAHGSRRVIVDSILRGDALLTRLDGEWW